jgi:hypothetical protein
MKLEDYLKLTPLTELIQLLEKSLEQLLASRLNKEDLKVINSNQRLVESIEVAIITKQAEMVSMK